MRSIPEIDSAKRQYSFPLSFNITITYVILSYWDSIRIPSVCVTKSSSSDYPKINHCLLSFLLPRLYLPLNSGSFYQYVCFRPIIFFRLNPCLPRNEMTCFASSLAHEWKECSVRLLYSGTVGYLNGLDVIVSTQLGIWMGQHIFKAPWGNFVKVR